MPKTAKILCITIAGCASEASTSQQSPPLARERETIELAQAKLLVEHNATDEDTGFQGFVDGEPWKQLDIRDPNGKLTASFEAKGNLQPLGLTELFFETDEPPNDEVPIADMLAILPAGDYDFTAKTADGLLAKGTATLSHTIPAGPVITSPATDAVVSAEADLVFRWSPVTTSVCGGNVTITHYQLIVSKLEQPPGAGFGAETVSTHVPASVTAMRVPHEFLQPGTAYGYEVLAIEIGGNQTLSSGEFSTL